MKNLTILILALVSPVSIFAQVSHNPPLSCQVGGQTVTTQGLLSTTTVQRSIPQCTVTVYLTGTLTLATIYSNSSLTPLANPFTANTDGSIQFWAANSAYDIVTSGGLPGNTFPSPVTYTDVQFGGGGGSGGTPGGTNQQFQYNNNGIFGGIAGSSWDGANWTLSATSFSFNAAGGGVLASTSAQAEIETASTGSNAGLLVLQSSSAFTDCSNVSFNTNHKLILGDDSVNPFTFPTLCGDDTGWHATTPTAGDSSTLIATTAFFTTPGPIGSVTPNSLKGTTLQLTTIATGIQCLHADASGNITGTGSDCGSGGGSGTITAGANLALTYYCGAGTTVCGDSTTTLSAGALGVVSLTTTGAGVGVLTLAQGPSISNPPSSQASLFVSSVTNNLTCTLSTGASCLTLPGAPGGANGSLQFKNSSALGGTTFIFDGTSKITGPSSSFQSDTLLGGTGCTNDTVTGVVQNELATVTAGKCIELTTAQIGVTPTYLIVGGTFGTSGSSYPLAAGFGSCVFDGATTAGHLFGASTTSRAECTDLGTATFGSVTSGLWVGGIVLTSNGGGGTYAVAMSQGQISGGGGGGGGNMTTLGANTMSTGGTIDLSAATGINAFRVPNISGATATSNGAINYDTGANKYHGAIGGVDKVFCTTNGEAGCGSSSSGPPSQTGNTSLNIVRTTADVTITNSSLTAITGLNWTLPASTAANYKVTCSLMYTDSSTSSSAVAFGVQDVTTAPTSASGTEHVQNNGGNYIGGFITALASTTATAFTSNGSIQPALTTVMSVDINMVVEQPSGSASVFQIMGDIAGGVQTLTIKKDSSCELKQVSN